MKKFPILLILALAAFFAYRYFFHSTPPGDSSQKKITGLPWQIEKLADGNTRVFGLTPGVTTLGEAKAVLGKHMTLAIIAQKEEKGSLEAYYNRFTAGVLTGRLILLMKMDEKALEELRGRSRKKFLDSGAYKFILHPDDLPRADRAPVEAITFIPQANFDEKIIFQRFGKPAEKIQLNKLTTHYLFPEKGLDIILDSKGKEVLQYVSPKNFTLLTDPLRQKQNKKEK